MQISYDDKLDVLYVTIRDASVARTVEVGPALLDLDGEENIVAFEILGASDVIERVAELAKQPNLEAALANRLHPYLEEARRSLKHHDVPF